MKKDKIQQPIHKTVSVSDPSRRKVMMGSASLVAAAATGLARNANAQDQEKTNQANKSDNNTDGSGKRPNILVIFGDDIGWQNVSAYGHGTMGYRTPNLDRIAKEGIMFTDHYGQPSCTAGRAAFLTGQYPIRSGMVTVGQPGDKLGLQQESPSIGEVMKKQGYKTGHFGKSHVGDRNEHLPTVHGFDEFYGNLYHLNVSEQFQQRDYQNFAEQWPGGADVYADKFGARGVIHSLATDTVDETEDPRFGKIGKQTVTDTGPLTKDRMRTFDEEEIFPRAMEFMSNAQNEDQPFFMWLNPTRMHLYVRLDDKWRYAAEDYTTEADVHGSGMMKHDFSMGELLDFLDESGLAENTVLWYSTDNGPEHSSWPDGATTPFRGEKMTTYEGGVRLLSMLRWPGVVEPGQVLSGIQCHQDMFVSLAKIAGSEDPFQEMMDEKQQYLDGVDNLPYWKGETTESARNHVMHYFESELTAIRMGQWKWHFSVKEDYYDNMTPRNYPLVFNIRMDPFESYDSIDSYGHLLQKISWMTAPMGAILGDHLETLKKYPPVQGGKTFDIASTLDSAIKKLQQ